MSLEILSDGICCRADFKNTRHFWLPPGVQEPQHLRNEREWKAKRLCRVCPVQVECLQWAEAMKLEYGVWGGKGEDERGYATPVVVLSDDGTPMRDWHEDLAPCGTPGGLEGHAARGEDPCGPCIWWAHEDPICGEPTGIADHVRKEDPLCDKCRTTQAKYREELPPSLHGGDRGAKWIPWADDCGTPDGPRYHRSRGERPCANCCAFICGTDAGYASHLRYKEWTDPGCRAAHAAKEQERQVRRFAKLDEATTRVA